MVTWPVKTREKSNDERELIFKLYSELGSIERHSSGVQSQYRVLASTWMLAVFAGIGFVISKEFSFDIPKQYFVIAIGFAGLAGLLLLWVLDLMFYQRLLDPAYIEAMKFESAHDWLPQTRNNIRRLLQGKGLRIVLSYYIALTEVMVFICGAGWIWLFWPLRTGTFLGLRTGPLTILCVITALASLGLMIRIAKFMIRITSTTPELEGKLKFSRFANIDTTQKLLPRSRRHEIQSIAPGVTARLPRLATTSLIPCAY